MTLGAAVVGLGVGEAHARAYAAHPETLVRWLVDLDRDRAAKVAHALGQGSPAASLDEVLADPEVDIVSIASYDDAHYSQTMAALRAGKHVFVEKPMCRSMRELREIARAWRERPALHLASNHILRAAPLYRWLREALREGVLGRPYAIDADYLYGRLEKVTHGWRSTVPDYSVMAGGGIHMVDLVLWLTGRRPERAHAVGSRVASGGTAFRYDDYTAATLTFQDGLVARVTANFGSVHRHQHVLSVYATGATFLYDDAGARLYRSRDPRTPAERVDLAPEAADKGALIGPFLDAIVHGEEDRADTETIFDAMAVCFAIDRAKEVGAPVAIEYP